jgi:two-component sensor histidine kinase
VLGRVTLEGAVADGGLVLAWREEGGPRVAGPPARAGFGTALLRQVVEYQHEGRVELDWRPQGLACTLRLPLAEVAERGAG